MNQESSRKNFSVYNAASTDTTSCDMREGQALPQVTQDRRWNADKPSATLDP